MPKSPWLSFLASALVYSALTAYMGRDVVTALDSRVLKDAGDPVLNAAILAWNAQHVPLSQAWWDFPIFHPVPDTLTFSEHLFGLSVLATPLYWLTQDALVTYNIVALLCFPLSALAMFVLVRHLTKSDAAAFVAGLAFGFAPYRMAHTAQVQVLAAFWMPLGLLGLHRYVESGQRRWLALFATSWLLQGLTNGYFLVFFSILVGLWVLWFVVRPRRWHALRGIVASLIVAALPLVPILSRYTTLHARHGFVRSATEVESFSADLAALFCAAPELAFWRLTNAACKIETELFPGLTMFALMAAAGIILWRRPRPRSTLGFYVVAALICWAFCLGPSVTFFGRRVLPFAPYEMLAQLPGVDSLRVPARFWTLAILCLAVAAGLVLGEVMQAGRRRVRALLLVAGLGLCLDFWVPRFQADAAPSPVPDARRLAGAMVMEMPLGTPMRDAPAVFRAVTGGWHTVNGYSGYQPLHYDMLREAQAAEDDSLLAVLRTWGDLHVVVRPEAPRLRRLVERAPGARVVAETVEAAQFLLPQDEPLLFFRPPGKKLPIAALKASCANFNTGAMIDNDVATRWECGPQVQGQEVIVELERSMTVGAVVHALGPYSGDHPRELLVETSADGVRWETAWNGGMLGPAMIAALEDPRDVRALLPFQPREARTVRLRQTSRGAAAYWSIAELEVRGATPSSPGPTGGRGR